MVAAPVNQSIKFVPAGGLHRTPLSGRRLFQRYVFKDSILENVDGR